MKRSETFTAKNINLYVERSRSEVCMVNKITVNGYELDVTELGYLKDIEPEKAPLNGCGNRVFIPYDKFFSLHTYKKEMKLRDEDFIPLKELLVKALSIGYCKRCR